MNSDGALLPEHPDSSPENNSLELLQEFLWLTSKRNFPEILEQTHPMTYLKVLESFWREINKNSQKDILSSPKIFLKAYKQKIQGNLPIITEKQVLKYRRLVIKQFTSYKQSFKVFLELKLITLQAFQNYLNEYLQVLISNENFTQKEQDQIWKEIFMKLMKIKTIYLIEAQQVLNTFIHQYLSGKKEAKLPSSEIHEVLGKNRTKSKEKNLFDFLSSLSLITPIQGKTRSRKYQLKKTVLENGLMFLSKLFQLSLIHYFIFTHTVIIPPSFYKELLKHQFVIIHGIDVRIRTYKEVEDAMQSLNMIMPMTLIGEDEDSRQVIFKLVERKVPIRTLIHLVPAQSILEGDTIDDERVKEVDKVSTAELRVMKSLDLMYPPIAIVDIKKTGIIPLHGITMSFNPTFLIYSQDKAFLHYLESTFEAEWDKAWVYEDIIEPIVQLLNCLKEQQDFNELPGNIKQWLIDNNFLEYTKKNHLALTEYGRMFLASKTY